jgi:group II intron reverse transcriptase/maturase
MDNARRSEGPMTIGDEPTNAEKVQKLQAALRAKAKESPNFRFYALYDKVYRKDVLGSAFWQCRFNDGAPGVDRQTFTEILEYGVERWLDELAEELRTKGYRPQAVRRVYIPKPDGKQRPLVIPTIKDRVVQTALLLVLEPIFETDLQPEQYAYRPDRSALDAVQAVHRWVCYGHTEVIDADLSGYFDAIPHAELMQCLARRISDKGVLHLLKMWLDAPVEEADECGHVQRTTRNRDTGRGTPQGAPISPLLANLYMRRFVLGWKTLGHEQALQAKIVNYADDFVILCRGTAKQAMIAMRAMMAKLKLTVNEAKTKLCRLPEESFDFLGYTIGPYWSWKQKRMVLSTRPSTRAVKRLQAKISEITGHNQVLLDEQTIVGRLNRLLSGWAKYFCRGPVSEAYRNIDLHVRQQVRRWLSAKHQTKGQGINRYSDPYLFRELGLIKLTTVRTQHLRGRTT